MFYLLRSLLLVIMRTGCLVCFRPNISQFRSLKIHQTAFLNYTDPRVLGAQKLWIVRSGYYTFLSAYTNHLIFIYIYFCMFIMKLVISCTNEEKTPCTGPACIALKWNGWAFRGEKERKERTSCRISGEGGIDRSKIWDSFRTWLTSWWYELGSESGSIIFTRRKTGLSQSLQIMRPQLLPRSTQLSFLRSPLFRRYNMMYSYYMHALYISKTASKADRIFRLMIFSWFGSRWILLAPS